MNGMDGSKQALASLEAYRTQIRSANKNNGCRRRRRNYSVQAILTLLWSEVHQCLVPFNAGKVDKKLDSPAHDNAIYDVLEHDERGGTVSRIIRDGPQGWMLAGIESLERGSRLVLVRRSHVWQPAK
jgi:hypothetical protein